LVNSSRGLASFEKSAAFGVIAVSYSESVKMSTSPAAGIQPSAKQRSSSRRNITSG
jgi:hypothetical protein